MVITLCVNRIFPKYPQFDKTIPPTVYNVWKLKTLFYVHLRSTKTAFSTFKSVKLLAQRHQIFNVLITNRFLSTFLSMVRSWPSNYIFTTCRGKAVHLFLKKERKLFDLLWEMNTRKVSSTYFASKWKHIFQLSDFIVTNQITDQITMSWKCLSIFLRVILAVWLVWL